jgi:hypothetical protein
MNRAKLSAKELLLISGLGIAAAALAGSALAAVPPSSGSSIAATVVIRGSDPATAQRSSAEDAPPTVLRGSPPAAVQPPAQYACPSGYDYDPSYGCVTPGYAYNPYDYGDWPYWGFDGFSSGDRRHGLSRPNRRPKEVIGLEIAVGIRPGRRPNPSAARSGPSHGRPCQPELRAPQSELQGRQTGHRGRPCGLRARSFGERIRAPGRRGVHRCGADKQAPNFRVHRPWNAILLATFEHQSAARTLT